MVEISYGAHSEQADLAGKSVAEAREQYEPVFGIPDKAKAYLSGERAQAYLNRKQVKKDLEPETKLSDEDKLSFAEKSRRGLFMIGALLLALAITGGVFAYAQTTATVTLGVTAAKDFVTAAKGTGAEDTTQWTVFGRYKGSIVTPDDYTTGTATFTKDDTPIVGTGTTWTDAMVGRQIRNGTIEKWYTIESVTDTTHLTLTKDYEEATTPVPFAYTIRAGNFFTVTPAEAFSGDMVAVLYIANADQLTEVYRVLNMRIEVMGKDALGASQIWPAGVEADYIAGSATFTKDAETVEGAGTTWTSAMAGRRIRNDATDVWYTIDSITSTTELELTKKYAETTTAVPVLYTIRDIGVALLTLDKGVVEIELTDYQVPDSTLTPPDIGEITVRLKSGFYISHRWVSGKFTTANASPLLFLDVVQKGAD